MGIELPWNGWDNWWSYAGEAQVLRALLAVALVLVIIGWFIIPTVESTSFSARTKTWIASSFASLLAAVVGWLLWKRHIHTPRESDIIVSAKDKTESKENPDELA